MSTRPKITIEQASPSSNKWIVKRGGRTLVIDKGGSYAWHNEIQEKDVVEISTLANVADALATTHAIVSGAKHHPSGGSKIPQPQA